MRFPDSTQSKAFTEHYRKQAEMCHQMAEAATSRSNYLAKSRILVYFGHFTRGTGVGCDQAQCAPSHG
jgi:hypothetical protein